MLLPFARLHSHTECRLHRVWELRIVFKQEYISERNANALFSANTGRGGHRPTGFAAAHSQQRVLAKGPQFGFWSFCNSICCTHQSDGVTPSMGEVLGQWGLDFRASATSRFVDTKHRFKESMLLRVLNRVF